MRPYICTSQRVQAWRWIVAEESMTFRNWAPEVILRLSRGTTATTENIAPFGFQHLVQPQAWLCATLPVICTVTGAWAHWQLRVPPLKFALPLRTPLSTDGWMEMAGMVSPLFLKA